MHGFAFYVVLYSVEVIDSAQLSTWVVKLLYLKIKNTWFQIELYVGSVLTIRRYTHVQFLLTQYNTLLDCIISYTLCLRYILFNSHVYFCAEFYLLMDL